jgi:hypothetical protein
MTITDTGRRTRERLLDEARREVGDGPLPTKTALSKTLGTHFNRASEILEVLDTERRTAAAERARARRQAMARLGRRKQIGRPKIVIGDPFRNPSVPVHEALADAEVDVDLGPASEGVRNTSTEPVRALLPVFDYAVPIGPMPAPVAVEGGPGRRRPKSWPLVLLTLPAFVAIWGGWVDLGRLTGFGVVHPFPGIPTLDQVAVNLAITLPIGLETYAAYALSVWLSGAVPAAARRFAKSSAIGSLLIGFAGQAAYHLMIAAGWVHAPWWITLLVSGVPVGVLGMGAALHRLVHAEED